jgi:hypothetical protein
MIDLDASAAAALVKGHRLNLIRRGADDSLVMSTDGWRLVEVAEDALTLRADPPAPPETEPLVIRLAEVERITWDRLARQHTRSQVRFHLRSGERLTFSGRLPEPQ